MFDFKEILPAYIAHGKPSADTLRHYETEISNFLNWVEGNGYDPLKIDENDARQYLAYLTERGYSDASVAIKIAAARTYYFITTKLKLTAENPFQDVKAKAPVYDDADFDYLTVDEIAELCAVLKSSPSVTSVRNLAIVMLMAVEGLRTVEVSRMNDEDINRRNASILIHGKGRDAFIYPCQDTIDILEHYIQIRPTSIKDDNGTPTFISLASNFLGTRITRTGIRWAINSVLTAAEKKKRGASCHMLRHSCGTNLYAKTKDLRLVQEVLRQKDPAVTARYTHVNRRDYRKTGDISPFGGDTNET